MKVFVTVLIICFFVLSGCTESKLVGEWNIKEGELVELPSNSQANLTSATLNPSGFRYVFFFATYCPECIQEIKFINEKLVADESLATSFLAVSVDETKEIVEEYCASNQIKFPLLWDEAQQFSTRIGGEFIPRGILIDSNNKVIKFTEGFSASQLNEVFAQLKN